MPTAGPPPDPEGAPLLAAAPREPGAAALRLRLPRPVAAAALGVSVCVASVCAAPAQRSLPASEPQLLASLPQLSFAALILVRSLRLTFFPAAASPAPAAAPSPHARTHGSDRRWARTSDPAPRIWYLPGQLAYYAFAVPGAIFVLIPGDWGAHLGAALALLATMVQQCEDGDADSEHEPGYRKSCVLALLALFVVITCTEPYDARFSFCVNLPLLCWFCSVCTLIGSTLARWSTREAPPADLWALAALTQCIVVAQRYATVRWAVGFAAAGSAVLAGDVCVRAVTRCRHAASRGAALLGYLLCFVAFSADLGSFQFSRQWLWGAAPVIALVSTVYVRMILCVVDLRAPTTEAAAPRLAAQPPKTAAESPRSAAQPREPAAQPPQPAAETPREAQAATPPQGDIGSEELHTACGSFTSQRDRPSSCGTLRPYQESAAAVRAFDAHAWLLLLYAAVQMRQMVLPGDSSSVLAGRAGELGQLGATIGAVALVLCIVAQVCPKGCLKAGPTRCPTVGEMEEGLRHGSELVLGAALVLS